MDSPLGCGEIPASATADELFAMYDRTLRDIADQFAPERMLMLGPVEAAATESVVRLRVSRHPPQLSSVGRTRSAADGQALTAAQRHRSTVFKDKRD